ncbi:MAG: site-specific DNA-methyltransferase [Armatimonadetes bacterium]|nr:site-specific DNA-methyltransferase [Armatimonadota bacterium]
MGTRSKMATKLDGKTWLRYSISVWDDIEKSPEERALNHPAMYPAALVTRLLDAYLRRDQGWVLDPFLGSGSTLVAAREAGLCGIGVEVVPEFADMARQRLANQPSLFSDTVVEMWEGGPVPAPFLEGPGQRLGIVLADARLLAAILPRRSMDILVTSPPYWHIHTRKRTADRKRERPYSDQPDDLGNVARYEDFLAEVGKVFEGAATVLKPGSYCIVNVMDIRVGPRFVPYHADISRVIEERGFVLDDIIIWDRRREYNNLRPLGYPHKFIVNKVHEYLLVFRLPVK